MQHIDDLIHILSPDSQSTWTGSRTVILDKAIPIGINPAQLLYNLALAATGGTNRGYGFEHFYIYIVDQMSLDYLECPYIKAFATTLIQDYETKDLEWKELSVRGAVGASVGDDSRIKEATATGIMWVIHALILEDNPQYNRNGGIILNQTGVQNAIAIVRQSIQEQDFPDEDGIIGSFRNVCAALFDRFVVRGGIEPRVVSDAMIEVLDYMSEMVQDRFVAVVEENNSGGWCTTM